MIRGRGAMVAFSKAIISDADDGYDTGSAWIDQDSPYANAVYFEVKKAATERQGGTRFTVVTVPQGATINSATITLEVESKSGTVTGIQLFGDDVDDAPVWSNTSRPMSGFTDTTGGTQQTTTPSAGNSVVVDCAACVQDIVNRVGWSSGNAMRFRLEMAATYARMRFDDYETDGIPVEAVLDIDYTAGAGGSDIVILRRRIKGY